MIDFSSMSIEMLLPIFVIALLLFVAGSALNLPSEYYKNKQIREAMMKRRAEKKDLEAIEAKKLAEMDSMLEDDFNIDDL